MSVKWSARLVLAGVAWAILWLGATVAADIVGHWTFDEIGADGFTPNSGAGGSALNGKLVGDVSGSDVWGNLVRLSRVVRQRQHPGVEQPMAKANVQLGTWYCAGPLRDTAEGLHLRSFAAVFPPQQQALAAGRKAIELNRTWPVQSYPGTSQTRRGWIRHPEWTDGYVNPLPVGPPPMSSETCYLYRTITAKQSVTVPMHVFALDNVRAWLNGELVGTAHNPARLRMAEVLESGAASSAAGAEGSRRAGVVPAPARTAPAVCRQQRSRLSGDPSRIDARARETSGETSRRYACRHPRSGQE